MNIASTREQMRTTRIYDIPMRVTYYARVSSEKDEQLNSLDNQIFYYEDLIKKNPQWTFVPGYIDEGLSGISTKKRENFNRMIEDAGSGLFDLILTKEISRFARNTLDSIQYTRQLLTYGVGVFFQNDNINTLDEDSELRLSIMSSIAQDELRKLSSRVKFGHQQAIRQSVVLGNARLFGYDKANGKLIINESEAEMVRKVFELYASGDYSMKQIETMLWNEGYRNHNGNRISHSTLSNMISNPKYKGYYVGNKVRIVDMFTKKQMFLPEDQWVMHKDESGEIVPQIVSEELWEKANVILKRRSKDVKERRGLCNHKNLLTGKLYCTECGAPYYRKDSVDRNGNGRSRWVCSGKIKNGAQSCNSFPIYEDEIIPLILDTFKNADELAHSMQEEYERLYLSMFSDGRIERETARQKSMIDLALKKKSKLLELAATDKITNRDFKQMTDQCNREIEAAEEVLEQLKHQMVSKNEFQKHMERIKKVLQSAEINLDQGVISKEFIETYIDQIHVTPQDNNVMRLELSIFTGQKTELYLKRLRETASVKNVAIQDDNLGSNSDSDENCCSRTGHTKFTICPPTEPASREVRSPL